MLPSLKAPNLGPVPFALLGAVVTVVPSMLFLWLLQPMLPSLDGMASGTYRITSALLLVFFYPTMETLLMMPVMVICRRICGNRSVPGMLLTALLFALLHGTQTMARVPFALWGFVVFGYVYLYWEARRPHSFLWIVLLTHMLSNVPAAVLTGLG